MYAHDSRGDCRNEKNEATAGGGGGTCGIIMQYNGFLRPLRYCKEVTFDLNKMKKGSGGTCSGGTCKADIENGGCGSCGSVSSGCKHMDIRKSSILNSVGVPLVVIKNHGLPELDNEGDVYNDNQLATYLMADEEHGFAPPSYQKHLGSVVLFRSDNKKITQYDVDSYWNFLSDLMNYRVGSAQFDSWDEMKSSGLINRANFLFYT